MAQGYFDSQGVWHYGEDDVSANASEMLNRLAESVSAALAVSSVSDWEELSLAATVVQQGTTLPRAQNMGNRTFLAWGFSGSGFVANGAKVAAYLPPTMRPDSYRYMVAAGSNAVSSVLVAIAPSGALEVRTGGTVPNYIMLDGLNFERVRGVA